MEPHEKALGRIKIELIGSKTALRVAYGKALFSVRTIWTEQVSTAGINVHNLYINPVFFMDLDPKEREGLIAHEALHLLYRHCTDFRTFKRSRFTDAQEHALWNQAGDYRINYDLKAAGYKLPPMGLYDERYDDTWSTLAIYKELHDKIDQGERSAPDGDEECDVLIPEKDDQAKDAAKNKKIVIAANHAASACKAAGDMPGQLQRIINESRRPKIDFFTILANYMNGVAHNDYSMRRPNRRYWPEFILPSLYTEALEDLAIIFDLSGSVDDEQAGMFKRAIRITKEQLQPSKITFLTFDTEISEAQEIKSEDDINKIKFLGGGGTDIEPVLNWIVENRPRVVMIFTDGWFDDVVLERNPESDIVWIIHDNPEFRWPYGKVVHHRFNS